MAVERPTHRPDLSSDEVQGGRCGQFQGHIEGRSGRTGAHPFDLNLAIHADKAVQAGYQPAQQKEARHGHPNPARQFSLAALEKKLNARQIPLDAPKPLGGGFAGSGEGKALPTAIEQLDAQTGLQVLQAAGDRRGVNAQRLGGAAHRSAAHHRRKELEVVPIHYFLPSRPPFNPSFNTSFELSRPVGVHDVPTFCIGALHLCNSLLRYLRLQLALPKVT